MGSCKTDKRIERESVPSSREIMCWKTTQISHQLSLDMYSNAAHVEDIDVFSRLSVALKRIQHFACVHVFVVLQVQFGSLPVLGPRDIDKQAGAIRS